MSLYHLEKMLVQYLLLQHKRRPFGLSNPWQLPAEQFHQTYFTLVLFPHGPMQPILSRLPINSIKKKIF